MLYQLLSNDTKSGILRFMRSLSARNQINTGDSRQLFLPEQLAPGRHIALVSVLEGAPVSTRLARAIFAFTGVLRQGDESTFRSIGRCWQHVDLVGLAPQWRGAVEWLNNDGAMARITGRARSPYDWAELVGTIRQTCRMLSSLCGCFIHILNSGWLQYATGGNYKLPHLSWSSRS
jgi:hypothetical protein